MQLLIIGINYAPEMVSEDLKTARRYALLKEHGLELPVSVEG